MSDNIWENKVAFDKWKYDINKSASIEDVLDLLEGQLELVPVATNWEGTKLLSQEKLMRVGVYFHAVADRVKNRISSLSEAGDMDSAHIGRLSDRLTAVIKDLLCKVFETTPEEINEGLKKFRKEMEANDTPRV